MAQQGNTLNFLIHDANGQPQVIKVVQATTNKPLTISNPKVFFKTPGQDVGAATVLRNLGIPGTKTTGARPPQVVTIPIQATASPLKGSPLKALGTERHHATILPQTLQFTTAPMVKSLQVLGSPQRLNTATSASGTAPTLHTATAVVVSGLGGGATATRGQVNLGTNVVSGASQPTVVHTQPTVTVSQPQQQQQQQQQNQQLQSQLNQQQQPAMPKNYISPILDHSGSRKRQETEHDFTVEYKRRKTEKVGKGLRHFSMKVCEKVRRKGTTSYNEVADELVAEFTNPVSISAACDQYDQKNIRRRVYDALNVLMAMSIISKEKKEIRWLGLPTNSLQECRALEVDRKRRLDRIRQKTRHLHDLIIQQIAFKNLVERNREAEKHQGGMPPPNSAIQLPFIIVSTSKNTVIDCSISNDKREYMFNFDDKFEIHDDIEVLKRMGMDLGLEKGNCSETNLQKAKSMIPKSLEAYVTQLGTGKEDPLLAGGSNNANNGQSSNLEDDLEVQRAVESNDGVVTVDMGVVSNQGMLSRNSSSLLEEPISPSLPEYFSEEEEGGEEEEDEEEEEEEEDESEVCSDVEVN